MLRKLLITAAALGLAGPAAAASFVLTISNPIALIPSNNDFQAQLGAAPRNFTTFTSSGADIGLDGETYIDFYRYASESGNNDTFTATGDVGVVTNTETTPFTPWGPLYLGRVRFNGPVASLTGALNFTSSGVNAAPATVGGGGFGIFLAPRATSGNYNELWFGYDDQLTNVDDNHDDYIVRAVISAVPEPATWGMMIGGMGVAGMALRRRRRAAVAAIV